MPHWLERKPLLKNERLWLLLLVALVVKLACVIYLSSLTIDSAPDRAGGRIALSSGDTFSYLGSIENYLATGEYYFWNGEEKVRAGRMPHYGVPYYFFRLIFDKGTANDLIVLSQVLLEAVAVILLSLMGYNFFRSPIAFWLIYVISLVSLNSTIFSIYLSPESFSISFLVIFLYFYSQYRLHRDYRTLLASSIFLGLLVVLKPYYVLLYVPLMLEIIRDTGAKFDLQTLRCVFIVTSLMTLFLALFLFPWIVRNYRIYGEIVPFQINTTAGYRYTEADLAFRRFAQAWGGSIVFWEKRSAGCYFQPQAGLECEFRLPQYSLAQGYSIEDVEKVRRDYIALQQNHSQILMQSVVSGFDRLTGIYRAERPFRYYVVSPLLLIKEFIFHSGSYYLPVKKEVGKYSLSGIILKGSQSFLYYFTLVLGLTGLVILTFRKRISIIFLSVPLILIFLFCFIIKSPEFRYFIHTYPLFIIGTTYCLLKLLSGLRLLKPSGNFVITEHHSANETYF